MRYTYLNLDQPNLSSDKIGWSVCLRQGNKAAVSPAMSATVEAPAPEGGAGRGTEKSPASDVPSGHVTGLDGTPGPQGFAGVDGNSDGSSQATPAEDNVGAGAGRAGGAGGEDASSALEALTSQLGAFGLYQRYVLVLLCLPNLLSAAYSLNYVFVADQVPFRCLVSECESASSAQFDGPVTSLLSAEQCRRYAPLNHTDPTPAQNQTCARDLFHAHDLVPCDNYVYESPTETIFAEFDLGCREWLRTLVGTIRNAALPLALVLTGYVSDVWGRRTAFCLFGGLAGALGLLKSLAGGYRSYVTLEFLEAALGYGFNSAAYVLLLETSSPALRGVSACATGVSYGLGGMLLSLTAWRLRGWRHVLRALHAPALLLPLYHLLLHESARWLVIRGRGDQAARGLRTAAKWNKVRLDEALLKSLESSAAQHQHLSSPPGASPQPQTGPSPWLQLLRSRALLRRFALCCWLWIASTFVYYGLTINSVSLSGDKYVNFALNMAMEVVASLLLMMALERLGRRKTILTSFLLCAVACVLPFFVSHTRLGFSLFFVGKLGATCAFNSLYIFTAELFPTSARSSALAACSLVGRAGSLAAPMTPLLGLNTQAVMYGACALSAALLALLAPETTRRALPSDVTRAEGLRRASAPPPPAPHGV